MIRREIKEKLQAKKDIKDINSEREKIIRSSLREDLKYSLPDDKDLTVDQISEIEKFWSKYKFALTPPLECFKTYFNRTGQFDPRFITYRFRKMFDNDFSPERYRYALQDKGYLPKIFSKGRQPKTLVRKIGAVILDTDYNNIDLNKAAEICYDYISNGDEIVIKANSSSGGGNSLVFVKDKELKEVKKILQNYKTDYTIQEVIKQHEVMSALNCSTVNTVRLTTFLLKDKVVALAALIKVGNKDVRVDNYKHGGHMIGIDLTTGRTLDWALDINYSKVKELPTGVDLSNNGVEVPYFKELVDMAIKCHYEIPRIRMVGWDIAIDEKGPVIIENNFSCDFRMHQVLTGPIFGEYTEEVLDEFLLKKFFKPGINSNYIYNEYYDHVTLKKYLGSKKKVIIPDTINGKPVTKIEGEAFKRNHKIIEVIIADSVRTLGSKAFYRCNNLKTVTLSKKMTRLQKETFANSRNLSQVINLENIKYIGGRCFYNCDNLDNKASNFIQVK